MTDFSLRRTTWVLRDIWLRDGRKWLLLTAALAGVHLGGSFLFLSSIRDALTMSHTAVDFYTFMSGLQMGLAVLAVILPLDVLATKESTASFLTLPASAMEKFAVLALSALLAVTVLDLVVPPICDAVWALTNRWVNADLTDWYQTAIFNHNDGQTTSLAEEMLALLWVVTFFQFVRIALWRPSGLLIGVPLFAVEMGLYATTTNHHGWVALATGTGLLTLCLVQFCVAYSRFAKWQLSSKRKKK